ncbi:MAG TPA: MaoC family dehydratase [Dermatophilaceae bacterium]|nr:MaoC family dehydratase [Dermatophilaceae bacterium]HOR16161.1 MaoC family dehydratase [Dermatophilaceae bacterium]HPK89835.1 MaoC family dehydratase [Dermatophilaceae bacterium]HQD00160.1 MaoC family dehydratase [Dermatophilaceae bacterium]HRC64940.1 MaoC family dehydratase [Dermatophilaceae bacterium]
MKTATGNFFEDFTLGMRLVHATPRTVSDGDVALYTALYGPRFAPTSGVTMARAMGLERMPLDSMLVFHVVFGKTVPDVSLNAVANLGYAAGRFGVPVYPGDTITAESEVIGLKANRDGKTGVVYVHSVGTNQDGATVLDYVRWVMVRKRDESAPAPETVLPELPSAVPVGDLDVPWDLRGGHYDTALGGSPYLWDDYAVGERIDHVDGMTIEESEHMLATRLYHNTAKVHFNQHVESQGRFGRRIVYGGHIISIARALSYNGLANAVSIAAINGGTHSNPTFAGDTVYAWSEVLERLELPGRTDMGALRLRTVATKDLACGEFPYRGDDGKYLPNVVLDVDYTVLIPRRQG